VQAISDSSVKNKLASDTYAEFVTKAMDSAQCNTAIFINKGFSGRSSHGIAKAGMIANKRSQDPKSNDRQSSIAPSAA
jgi:hypothetical protein